MSAAPQLKNPFPGPQPYRAADRSRFFGRDALTKKLMRQVLAHPVTTLFGPSGAGKSSIMQAGVIPRLEETYDFRVVRVDAWPSGEKPLQWLLRSIITSLELGISAADAGVSSPIDKVMRVAEQRSEQPILIYVDQLEQLLFPERALEEVESLLLGINSVAQASIQGLHIVLSLREDYLGRFRDRARDHRQLLEHGFRLGPLTVGEMVSAVCRAAAEGDPPQIWEKELCRSLMLGVRTPGESATESAEVQAAYAQVVCRALFQERASGRAESVIKAETILHRYLDATIDSLGPLRQDARSLLERHLVTPDGARTLRTEKELLRLVSKEKLEPILEALERSAILHAEAHQGSRYFEIGHDWLAKKVVEQREQREREAEQRLRDEEQARQLAKAKAQRRVLVVVAVVSAAVALIAGAVGLWTLRQRRAAERAAMCSEGARACSGNTPQSCRSGKWETLTACERQACVDGQCVGACVAGEKRCATNTPQTCSANGAWVREPTCGAPKHCQGGRCVVSCEPGVDVTCYGNIPQICDGSGDFKPGEPCKNSSCVEGTCKGNCELGAARCSAANQAVPEACDAAGQWKELTACTKGCVAGSCPGPSCEGLPETCGPEKNENCCLSPLVHGGTYNRENNAGYPATVSDFRLDRFEVSVGRFRRFLEQYPGSKPKPGGGVHSKIEGSGWDASWASNLPESQAAFKARISSCPWSTWASVSGVNDNLPMNCISWYEAFAFCAWDGGRLPTEAEWNYAAAGGEEQRTYPWSYPPASQTIDGTYAIYDCAGGGEPARCTFSDIPTVGSRSKKGDGKWGQADLAGSQWEWNLDEMGKHSTECNNCANAKHASSRVIRGGSWYSNASYLPSAFRNNNDPSDRSNRIGSRCVRTP